MSNEITQAFKAIGAEVQFEKRPRAFEIDIVQHDGREKYALRYPFGGTVEVEVVDVRPKDRHLVLDVTGLRLPISGRYLCGHDESHWFVAALPFHRRTQTVRGAMEMLKPAIVLREQKRKVVTHRRNRRKTAAYIRQGEWFFLPRPKMHVDETEIERGGQLARERGKPHRVECQCHSADGKLTFVRGHVSHPDHATLYLEHWHRVVQNNEAPSVPQPFLRMAYLD